MRERKTCLTAEPALGGITGLEDQSMKKVALGVALAASLSACATNPYGYNDPYYGNNNDQTRRAATGAALGAAGGAALGAVVGGKQYYRDTRGYCYYVDQYGRPVYDYNTRC